MYYQSYMVGDIYQIGIYIANNIFLRRDNICCIIPMNYCLDVVAGD